MSKTTRRSLSNAPARHEMPHQPNLSKLFQQVVRERQRSNWFHLTAQERLATMALFIGGTTITLSSLAWAAVSYMQHQRVRIVKLAGIADERVAQRATDRVIADDVAMSQVTDAQRELALAQRDSSRK